MLQPRLSYLLSVLGILLLNCAQAAAPAGSSRFAIFISDTHFGVGKDAKGRWNNFEDARWAPEFAEFLAFMNKMGGGKADLILNGDTLELWQSLDPNDCTDALDNNLGCTEAEALARLRTVLESHRPELGSLREFARSGDNRIIIVPGNHDVALLFKGVAAGLLKAIGAPDGRVQIAAEGYWLSPDGLIYAEHGHQIGKEVNRFDQWPKPFLVSKGIDHLQRPWGEQFVQRFYNSFEAKYPVIDNFSEDSLGVKYGVKIEGRLAVPKEFGRFAWFYLTMLSWQQSLGPLGGEGGAPEWDIAAIRQTGDRFLVESIPSTDPLKAAAELQLTQGNLGGSLTDLADDEIINICNWRKRIADEARSKGETPPFAQCPERSLGALSQKLLSSRDKVFAKHLDDTFERLLRTKPDGSPFLLFVFSHTHLAQSGFFPLAGSGRGWTPFVVNTGAWQRTVTPEQLNVIQGRRHIDDKEVLKLQPEDLPACYPVVIVEPYPDEPHSKLRYWRKDGKAWTLGETCGEQ